MVSIIKTQDIEDLRLHGRFHPSTAIMKANLVFYGQIQRTTQEKSVLMSKFIVLMSKIYQFVFMYEGGKKTSI